MISASCADKDYKIPNAQEIKAITFDIPLDSLLLLKPSRELPSFMDPRQESEMKYIVYFDSKSCATCKLNRLGIWNSIIKNSNKIGADIRFIFIFHPMRKDLIEEFKNQYSQRRINMYVYLDTIGIVERLNPIMSISPIFHTFVINRENRIEVIGDVGSNATQEVNYYEFLRGKVKER